MNNKRKPIMLAISLFLVVILLSVSVFAALLYPNAKVVLSGIKIVTNPTDNTTQGFIDISVKELNATGVSFCLKYDTNLIQLSAIDTNEPIVNPSVGFNISHTYFEQNTGAFPENCFSDTKAMGMLPEMQFDLPILGLANAADGYLKMNFTPNKRAENLGDYIGYVDGEQTSPNDPLNILANTKDGVKLGRISFKILNPEKFSKLTEAELKEIIKMVPFSEARTSFDEDEEPQPSAAPSPSSEDADSRTGVYIVYIDDNENLKYVSHSERFIDCDLKIIPDLVGVEAQIPNLEVTAYDIYRKREAGVDRIQDLVDYLNEKSSVLLLCYADGSKVPVTTQWTLDDVSDILWDSKGGNYTVTKKYNQDFNVSVTVNVLPVKLTGIHVERQNLTYLKSDTENFPSSIDDLELPSRGRAILDTAILNGGIPNIEGITYLYEGQQVENTLPEGFGNETKSYIFTGNVNAGLDIEYPWLTVDSALDVEVVRNVIADESITKDDLPKEIGATATTSDDGTLKIIVSNKDGSEIDPNSIFEIRLPGGELIDNEILGLSTLNTEFTNVTTSGTAEITIKADPATAKKLAEAINLGERLGDFSITAVKTLTVGDTEITVKSTETPFASNPRKNIYLGPKDGSGVYKFDYSLSLSGIFPVSSSIDSLPTTITVPVASDGVGTTYDGYSGSEPGLLKTFTVDKWNVVPPEEGASSKTVTVTGRLADTSYTNYGEVENPDNIAVTIVYYTVEETSEDSVVIDPINFTFSKQQLGYDYNKLQTKSFTVTNNGGTDIYGLTAVISLSSIEGSPEDEKAEAFIMTKTLPPILNQGESSKFDITTKIGLPEGKYLSTVTLYSNNKELGTVNIDFEVTAKPVYNITVGVNDENYGSAKTEGEITTATELDLVKVIATPKNDEDYEFVGWESSVEGLIPENKVTEKELTFEMPASDVELIAIFKETTGAKLRSEELYLMKSDVELNEEKDNYLQMTDEKWQKIEYDSATREYYAVVPNDVEFVKLWFKLSSDEAKASTKTVSNTAYILADGDTEPSPTSSPAPFTETIGTPDGDYYKSSELKLELGPTENRVVLRMVYNVPADVSDEGEVSRDYTIHIYRKIVKGSDFSALATFNYGNSPAGRIMRDTSITDDPPTASDAHTAEQKKQKKKEEFKEANKYTFKSDYAPNGVRTDIKYTPEAWTDENYDLNDYALFVVNTGNFWDPGYTKLKNSIGQDVTADGISAKRVKIKTLQESDPLLKISNTDDFSYVSETGETLDLAVSGEISQLYNSGKRRIRPDIYWLEYIYKDYDGSNITVKKPLILIYPIGDIDVNGTVNDTDAWRLRERYRADKEIASSAKVSDYDIGSNIFRYRIVDANGDGYVNMLDYNEIEWLETEAAKSGYVNITQSEVAVVNQPEGGGTNQ